MIFTKEPYNSIVLHLHRLLHDWYRPPTRDNYVPHYCTKIRDSIDAENKCIFWCVDMFYVFRNAFTAGKLHKRLLLS